VFGIGMSEMVIILAVALLVFGPNKLPEIAKQLAKGLKEIRKAGDDLRSNLNFDLEEERPQRPLPAWRATPPNIAGSALADKLPSPEDPDHQPPPSTSAAPGTSDAPAAGEAAASDEAAWPKPADDVVERKS
jgi:TatA/E family protein of Tat protein translocase